ncbi:hypothetical protein Aph01nite_24850 [Acrocarpospora phusangensis]|uniref:Uncharacterized protein n=1 Tax=Acrocarpospora phusangensis TaxID=1070424 RepID=A0A919QCN4_9ACTN|nr:hypothetical protein Aph01nite_24850 [Acrocarpospora phusangensis]
MGGAQRVQRRVQGRRREAGGEGQHGRAAAENGVPHRFQEFRAGREQQGMERAFWHIRKISPAGRGRAVAARRLGGRRRVVRGLVP